MKKEEAKQLRDRFNRLRGITARADLYVPLGEKLRGKSKSQVWGVQIRDGADHSWGFTHSPQTFQTWYRTWKARATKKAPPTAEAKRRLREAAAAKRGVLLKDVEPAALFVLADRAKEEYRPDHGNRHSPRALAESPEELCGRAGCYLRWATAEQVEALSRALPWYRMSLDVTDRATGGTVSRHVRIFEQAAAHLLLQLAGVTKPEKYYRGYYLSPPGGVTPDRVKCVLDPETGDVVGWEADYKPEELE